MNASLRTRPDRPTRLPASPATPLPREPASARPSALSVRRVASVAVLIVVAVVCGVYAVAKWTEFRQTQPIRPFHEMKGDWIQAASDGDAYTGVFRRELFLPGRVRNAWLAVAACDGFELTVNADAIAWQHMWRPTRPFQTNLSERGQWLTWPKVAMSLNFAREYQWTDHKNYLLPVFVDLAPYLRAGRNVIGIEIESRQSPAKVRFDGAITLWNGQQISLASGTDWLAEVITPYYQNLDWRSSDYSALGWRHAAPTEAPPGQPQRAFDPRIFSTPFQGRWLRHPNAGGQESLWFETTWQLDHQPVDAWLRLATNRNYDLFINGRRGFPATPDQHGLEIGEWIFGHRRATDPLPTPEQMYSKDVGKEFLDHRHLAPRKEPAGVDEHRFKTIAPPPPSNEDDPTRALEPQKPLSSRYDQAIGAMVAYNLTSLLRAGANTIAIRLNRPAVSDPANWPGQLAVDGEVAYAGGARTVFVSDGTWKTRVARAGAEEPPWVTARDDSPALQADRRLTKLQYRGVPEPSQFLPDWAGVAAATSGGGLVLFAGLLTLAGWWNGRRTGAGSRALLHPPLADRMIALLFDALLPFTAVLASAILVQAAFGERSEGLWFFTPSVWLGTLVTALVLGALSAGSRVVRPRVSSGDSHHTSTEASRSRSLSDRALIRTTRLRAAAVWVSRLLAELPGTRLWIFVLALLCIATFFLRMYRLEFQPLDYDESPSLHAILSIARTGIPYYVPEAVWYTRSPLYHYLTAAFVWLLGENLWAARLPSALFSVATGLLLYFCGSRLLHRPWIGMAAFALTLVHPQMVMTGHMIRFYQQQQFFSLLMFYWFCKGFVTEQSQRYRYLTVAAFLAATLSQEITAVVAVPLAIGYLLFGAKKTIAQNVRLLIALGCAMVIIAVDFAVYETHTLTRLEGYSTTMQADVGPHLWEPYNFLTMFLSYSRLHLLLSVMFLLGLPAMLRNRDRVVLALHLLFVGSIVMLNLMVTQVSVRYLYWLFPLFFLLSLDNARAGLAWLDEAVLRRRPQESPMATETPESGGGGARAEPDVSRLGFASLACFTVLLAATVVSWSPWRLPGTFETKLLSDADGAYEYVRSQMRPGDLVVVTQPGAKHALIAIGKVDYELHIPIVYDFVLRENGRLIERGAGADVIYTVRQLQEICAEHRRVWFAIDREKFPFRGLDIDFGRTGARVELFLRRNTELMHRTHLWNVHLWDADRGQYRTFRSSRG